MNKCVDRTNKQKFLVKELNHARLKKKDQKEFQNENNKNWQKMRLEAIS